MPDLLDGDALFRKPTYDLPEIPRDLTEVDDATLMELFASFVAWQNFVATEVAAAEVVELRADARLRQVQAMKTIGSWDNPKDSRVALAKAESLVDPEVQAAEDSFFIAKSQRKVLSVIYDNCDRSANLVSRELTRRVGRDPRQRRADRWNP